MALDMEGEFYKLAQNILSKPQNLYKMAAISPKDGRLSLMGAEGYVVVPKRSLLGHTKGPEEKAYKLGRMCGEDAFGSLVREFDQEIQALPPRKLAELGLLLSRLLGWGSFEIVGFKEKAAQAELRGELTLESGYVKAEHHQLTCGFLAGVLSKAFKAPMKGTVGAVGKGGATFRFEAE